MNTWDAIGPLLGFLAGAATISWTLYLRNRKERKASLGVALADLLELRHRVVATELIVEKLKEASVPDEVLPHFRNLIETMVFPSEDASDRYSKAITLLSTVDPLTAFELRSRNLIPKALNQWRASALQGGVNIGEWERLEREFLDFIKPKLDDGLLRLARLYSFSAGWEVKRLVKKKNELPKELKDLFERVAHANKPTENPTPPAQG